MKIISRYELTLRHLLFVVSSWHGFVSWILKFTCVQITFYINVPYPIHCVISLVMKIMGVKMQCIAFWGVSILGEHNTCSKLAKNGGSKSVKKGGVRNVSKKGGGRVKKWQKGGF